MVALTAFDVLIVALTVHEYRVQRRLREAKRADAGDRAVPDAG
jgi:uncharacterized membrane protein